MDLMGTQQVDLLQATLCERVEDAIKKDRLKREGLWSEQPAVGRSEFVAEIKRLLL